MATIRSLGNIESGSYKDIFSKYGDEKFEDLFNDKYQFSEIAKIIKDLINSAKLGASHAEQKQKLLSLRKHVVEKINELEHQESEYVQYTGDNIPQSELKNVMRNDPLFGKNLASAKRFLKQILNDIDMVDLPFIQTVDNLERNLTSYIRLNEVSFSPNDEVYGILRKINELVNKSSLVSKNEQLSALYDLVKEIESNLSSINEEHEYIESEIDLAKRISPNDVDRISKLGTQLENLRKKRDIYEYLLKQVDLDDGLILHMLAEREDAFAENKRIDEEKIIKQDMRIDTSRNLWESFVEEFELGQTRDEQISTLMGMILSEAEEKYWDDSQSEAASEAASWLGMTIGTKSGETRTLQQVLNTTPDRVLAREIEDRIKVLTTIFEGSYNWYEIYDNGSPDPIIDHLRKYLLPGTELQVLKEMGYTPYGMDFFDIFGEAVSKYITWNDDHILLSEEEIDEINNLSDEEVLNKVGGSLGQVIIPPLSVLSKLYDFDKKTVKDSAELRRILKDELKNSLTLEQVIATSLEALLTQPENIQEHFYYQRIMSLLRDRIIQDQQKTRLFKFGIFPQKELGDQQKKIDPDTGVEVTNTRFYRKTEVIPHLENYILNEVDGYNKLMSAVIEEMKKNGEYIPENYDQNNTFLEKLDDKVRKKASELARQAELLAFSFYNSQGLTTKDDEIQQFATNKLWRLIATAWYRLKYPGQEGADLLKGEILQLIPSWLDYASVRTVVDNENKTIPLRAAFANRELRQGSNFAIGDKAFRNTYIERGVRLANEIYQLLSDGLGFEIKDIAQYVKSGDITDRRTLVLTPEIVNKLLSVWRSIVGYYIDAFLVNKNTTDGIKTYHDGWTPLKRKDGSVLGYSLLIDTIEEGGVDLSMINLSSSKKGELIEEMERIGAKKALQKWFMSILIQNHLILRSGLAYMPDDDVVGLCVALTGEVPKKRNGKPVAHRFDAIMNTPATPMEFIPEEVLMMVDQAMGARSIFQAVLHSIMSEETLL